MPTQIALSVLGSVVAGVLIGLEREFRARPAGLRTHTLVCVASALLMIAATRQDEWVATFISTGSLVTDPTRMAHGILTGIGFLCAGVIFREGFSVQGLTTAASLWMTSVLGLLFGVGLYALAICGTALTLVVLVGFRLLYRKLPRSAAAEIVVRSERDAGLTGAMMRDTLTGQGLTATLSCLRLVEGGRVEHTLQVSANGELDLEALGAALGALPGVAEYEIACRTEL